ncbi:MAG: type II toxin-antitoxin system VapC family toxin [Verrucomicrobiota bacterium]
MIYLDTGCLVKLYYPEPDSQKIVALVAGRPICFNPLHELEFINALHLKIFHRSASPSQVKAAAGLVEADVKSGVLRRPGTNWDNVFRSATDLARQHSASFGCRSLDVLHCAAALILGADEFVSADVRQKQLAGAMGLKLVTY